MPIQIKLFLIASVFTFTSSCNVNKLKVNKEFIKPNEVAFLEFFQTQDGEVLSGTATQGRRIDGPTYRFDKTTKQLDIFRKVDFSVDSVKAILGNGRILKGSAGSGLSMRLNPIRKFPFTMNNLTILKVSSEGVYIVFDQKELLLKEGEAWETSATSTDTVKMASSAVVRTKITYTIRYFGMIDKKSLKGN